MTSFINDPLGQGYKLDFFKHFIPAVFTRVTDGRRLMYYSIFILTGTGSITGMAACVHLFIEKSDKPAGKFKLGNFSKLVSF